MKGRWRPGNVACKKELAWQCRDVSDVDWCNLHEPMTHHGFMAWKLLDGYANEVDSVKPTDDDSEGSTGAEGLDGHKKAANANSKGYHEKSYNKMVALFNKTKVQDGFEQLHDDIIVVKCSLD